MCMNTFQYQGMEGRDASRSHHQVLVGLVELYVYI
jgi:hypothetical protein